MSAWRDAVKPFTHGRSFSFTSMQKKQWSKHWGDYVKTPAVTVNGKRAYKDMGPIIEYLVTVIDGSSLMSESGVRKAVGGRRTTRNDDDELEEGEEKEEGADDMNKECKTLRIKQVVERLQKIVRYEHGDKKMIIEEKLHIVTLSDRLFLSDLLPDQNFTSRSDLIAALSLTAEDQKTLEAVLRSLGDQADEGLGSGAGGRSVERGRERKPRERKRRDVCSQDNIDDNAPPKRGRTRGNDPAQENASDAAETLVGLRGSGSSTDAPALVSSLEDIKRQGSRLKENIKRLEAEIGKAISEFEKAKAELEKELEKAKSVYGTFSKEVSLVLANFT